MSQRPVPTAHAAYHLRREATQGAGPSWDHSRPPAHLPRATIPATLLPRHSTSPVLQGDLDCTNHPPRHCSSGPPGGFSPGVQAQLGVSIP